MYFQEATLPLSEGAIYPQEEGNRHIYKVLGSWAVLAKGAEIRTPSRMILRSHLGLPSGEAIYSKKPPCPPARELYTPQRPYL